MAFPHLARSGLDLQRVRRIYLFWPNQADTWVDTTATVNRKVRALQQHRSQLKHPESLEERIRTSARDTGERIGTDAAEAFRLVVIDEDEEEGP
jgi:LmbE family N-acetylglucosaminyl deacetylase